MNKTIQWLLVFGLLLFSNIGLAQEDTLQPQEESEASPLVLLPIGVTCGPRDIIMGPVLKAGEVLVATNLTLFKTMSQQELAGIGEIWINPQTFSFSYIMTFPETENTCYIFGGSKFAPNAKVNGTKVNIPIKSTANF
jgi:hypothetical protein